ncbi:hypothetical protein HYH03_001919 [Edaphochlamys debaryana]|uniref:U3 small nucleolar RNA-associated protein 25 n=1 Tax=Edaphochlamys debaryana TaxID=47281 RepID=A0A835YMD8_9CHLO|nr:hypothetical protein HYH03_001919 [Edaphochlamys debaryana]|eukprot:KAG2500344.1 hypothetical protein HYH03_001919 [Edaphochlamys debaryana]
MAKLARLLGAVGGGAKPGSAQPSGSNPKRPPPAATNGASDGNDGASKTRKRRRGGAKAPPPKPKPVKKRRREPGPAANPPGAAGAAGTAVVMEDPGHVEADRQRLLAGRSAYEALMDELARGREGASRGRGGGGGGGGASAALRAELQRLRSEQRGESSEEGEGEDEDDEGEESEGEGEESDEGEEGVLSEEAEEPRGKGKAGRKAPAAPAAAAAAAPATAPANVAGVGAGNGTTEGGADRGDGGEGGSGDGGASSDADDYDDDDAAATAAAASGAGAGAVVANGAAGADGGGDADGAAGTGPALADGSAAEGETPAAAATAVASKAAVDSWARHLGRELTELEVAALEAGGADYRDAPPAEVHSSAWGPSALWQIRVWGAGPAGPKARGKSKGGARAGPDAGAGAAAGGAGVAEAGGASAAAAAAVGLTVLPAAPPTLPEYGVKERLITRWREVRKEEAAASASAPAPAPASTSDAGTDDNGDFANPQQRSLFALLNSYADVHLPARPYPTDPGPSAPDPLLDAVLLHALNHVAKTGDRIKKNNASIQAQQDRLRLQREQQAQQGGHKGGPKKEEGGAGEGDKAAAAGGGGGVEAAEGTPRDQGFTRAKVLILLPQRNFAFKAVRRLVALALRETRVDSVQGKEKFVEQFTDPDDMGEEEELDPATRSRLASKPGDHRALFAGNTDDHFRLGIKVTKGAVRLFADLYQADIMVASPVALATKLAEDLRADPHAAPDFLSSVELLVLDRADVLGMQNWAHVETVLGALNRLPREQHGTDIMRVRDWYLSGLASRYRQTVLLSAFNTAEQAALMRGCANHAGALRLALEQGGVLGQVVPQVRQLFERFPADSPAAAGDARFAFFMKAVWPRIKDSVARGLLIFVPSYFDFVRLRNALGTEDAVDFAAVSEYSSNAEVTRCRARFFHGQRRVMLYTERAHFYHRYRIRGIKDVLFYGLPDHAAYYPELLNLLEEGGAAAGAGAARGAGGGGGSHLGSVTALFCRWDLLQLERVVGSVRARRMIQGESGTYMFC